MLILDASRFWAVASAGNTCGRRFCRSHRQDLPFESLGVLHGIIGPGHDNHRARLVDAVNGDHRKALRDPAQHRGVICKADRLGAAGCDELDHSRRALAFQNADLEPFLLEVAALLGQKPGAMGTL